MSAIDVGRRDKRNGNKYEDGRFEKYTIRKAGREWNRGSVSARLAQEKQAGSMQLHIIYATVDVG